MGGCPALQHRCSSSSSAGVESCVLLDAMLPALLSRPMQQRAVGELAREPPLAGDCQSWRS